MTLIVAWLLVPDVLVWGFQKSMILSDHTYKSQGCKNRKPAAILWVEMLYWGNKGLMRYACWDASLLTMVVKSAYYRLPDSSTQSGHSSLINKAFQPAAPLLTGCFVSSVSVKLEPAYLAPTTKPPLKSQGPSPRSDFWCDHYLKLLPCICMIACIALLLYD